MQTIKEQLEQVVNTDQLVGVVIKTSEGKFLTKTGLLKYCHLDGGDFAIEGHYQDVSPFLIDEIITLSLLKAVWNKSDEN